VSKIFVIFVGEILGIPPMREVGTWVHTLLIGSTKRSAVGSRVENMKKDSLPVKMIIAPKHKQEERVHEHSTISYHKFIDIKRD